MDANERQEHLRSLIMSRAWNEIVIPEYEARLQKELLGLIQDGDNRHRGIIDVLLWAMAPQHMTRKEARARGRVAALKALLGWPRQEVEITDAENDRERSREMALSRATHHATWGWQSPVRPPEDS